MHSRRDWILGSLGLVEWQEIAAAQQHAHDAVTANGETRLEALDPLTARDVAAIAAQIIPSGDGPGATEAGVIFFIDRALATFGADKREAYRKGMAEINQKRLEMFPLSESLASLAPEGQIALIHAIETSEFFELIRTHTLMGFLGNPSYGGNRGKVGWKHIHFDDRMAFQPPFGYYDAGGEK